MRGRTIAVFGGGAVLGGVVGAAVAIALAADALQSLRHAEEQARAQSTSMDETAAGAVAERVARLERAVGIEPSSERAGQASRRSRRRTEGTPQAGGEPASELGGRDASEPDGDRSLDGAMGGAMGGATEFVERVRDALAVIESERQEAAAARKRDQAADKFLRDAARRFREYQGRLGLSDSEVERLHAIAEGSVERRFVAQDAGADQEALGVLDRETQREVKDILGEERYVHYRKLEIDRMARPVIANIASQVGVDGEQRRRIEGLLSEHIDRIARDEARLRSEELPEAERQRLRDGVTTANSEAWRRLREDILTDEQRDRVPTRR